MQRCRYPHDEGVLAVSSTSSGRQLQTHNCLRTTVRSQLSGTRWNDTLHLTQVLWPDHCVINRTDSLFRSQLNVLLTDLIVCKGYRCHASISARTYTGSLFLSLAPRPVSGVESIDALCFLAPDVVQGD